MGKTHSSPPRDPERILLALLEANDPFAVEVATVLSRLLDDRQALIQEQIAAEMVYEAQTEGWKDVVFSIHNMLQRLSKVVPDPQLARAARSMEDIKRRMEK